MSRQIRSTIHRLGQEAEILTRSETGTNEFNNPQSTWSTTGAGAQCVRTYPNRNTQVDGGGGPRERDRPLFIFSRGEEPPSDARIIYDGITYELKSPTYYDGHVAIFGEIVS